MILIRSPSFCKDTLDYFGYVGKPRAATQRQCVAAPFRG